MDSSRWEFYLCSVKEKPASIFFNYGVSKEPPLDKYPLMGYIRVFMKVPKIDGLSSEAESQKLDNIEDKLLLELTKNEEAVFVGRSTTDGFRDFFFYTGSSEEWENDVAEIMKTFGSYKFRSGIKPDPEWNLYYNYLFPTDMDWELINNRHLCENLEKKGDLLTEAREIEHFIYFNDEKSRTEFEKIVKEMEFSVRSYPSSEVNVKEFGIQIYRDDIPSYQEINEVSLHLYEIAEHFGGRYDGWHTFVVK